MECCIIGIIPDVGVQFLPVERLYRDYTHARAETEEVDPVEEIDFDSGASPGWVPNVPSGLLRSPGCEGLPLIWMKEFRSWWVG